MGPILIAIHGVKRAGKDTTADFFTSLAEASDPALSVARRGFADKGKWAFARQFFPTISMQDAIDWVDKFKESEYDFVLEHPRAPTRHELQVRFRNALAQFCTEGGRDIYGDDFWVDQLLPYNGIWEHNFDYSDIGLIRDLRFENEALRVRDYKRFPHHNVFTVKVKRADAEQAVVDEAHRQNRKVHRSELGLPDHLFDYVIDNSDNDMTAARKRTEHVWGSMMYGR